VGTETTVRTGSKGAIGEGAVGGRNMADMATLYVDRWAEHVFCLMKRACSSLRRSMTTLRASARVLSAAAVLMAASTSCGSTVLRRE